MCLMLICMQPVPSSSHLSDHGYDHYECEYGCKYNPFGYSRAHSDVILIVEKRPEDISYENKERDCFMKRHPNKADSAKKHVHLAEDKLGEKAQAVKERLGEVV